MKPSIDLVALCGCALAVAALMVKFAGGDPFTPSYVRVLIRCGGILICLAAVILRNQMVLKRMHGEMLEIARERKADTQELYD